jgi:hypothetical protein
MSLGRRWLIMISEGKTGEHNNPYSLKDIPFQFRAKGTIYVTCIQSKYFVSTLQVDTNVLEMYLGYKMSK